MFEFRAFHKKGLGTAAGNLTTQLPVIEDLFPEIKGCHFGTINLELPYPIIFTYFDHRTAPIDWDHARPGHTESFDLVRATVEIVAGSAPEPAWFYIPHGSPHRADLKTQELIAKPLATKPGTSLFLRIDRDWIQAPPYPPFLGGKIVI
jgi:hypothetical protein